jgi:soluble lytic murein transglycosylase
LRLLIVFGAVALALAAVVALYVIARAHRLRGCRQLAEHYAQQTGLDPALVLAVIQAESGGDPRAVSRAGAKGLKQLMPATAREVAGKAGIELDNTDCLFDPQLNVRLGTLYLAELRRLFNDDPYLYLAAYNAGPGNVDKWVLQNPGLTSRQIIERVAFAETRAYVGRVLRLQAAYSL